MLFSLRIIVLLLMELFLKKKEEIISHKFALYRHMTSEERYFEVQLERNGSSLLVKIFCPFRFLFYLLISPSVRRLVSHSL